MTKRFKIPNQSGVCFLLCSALLCSASSPSRWSFRASRHRYYQNPKAVNQSSRTPQPLAGGTALTDITV